MTGLLITAVASLAEPTGPINWFACGSRAAGVPQPFGAAWLNFAILLGLLLYMFRKPLRAFVAGRHATVRDALQEAKSLQADAQRKLEEYTARLRSLDAEIRHIREDLRLGVEAERARILKDAEERAERLRREAAFLAEQEAKTLRQELRKDAVDAMVAAVETILRERATKEDQERVAARYVEELHEIDKEPERARG